MRRSPAYDLPEDRLPDLRRATRLEWLSIAYLSTIVVLVQAVMGSSQAMRVAWAEDVLSLIPPITFLVAQKVRTRPPDDSYPYGYHRAITVGFLVAALALTSMGLLLLWNSAADLISRSHPTIGLMTVLGRDVWQGWPMIAVMIYASLPMVFLGRAKLQPARRIHDKVLHADADMNAADWKTGAATILGVLGVGFGLWWTDAAAAVFISFGVTRDGLRNLGRAVGDIMDRWPRTVDHDRRIDLDRAIRRRLLAFPYVRDVHVRLRDMGHVVIGEIIAVPTTETPCAAETREAAGAAFAASWRIYDLSIEWLDALPEEHDTPLADGPAAARETESATP